MQAHFSGKCIGTVSSRRLLFQLPQSLFEFFSGPVSGTRVLGSNGAENRFKGRISSKLDQKHLFSTHLGLIRNLFTLSLRKSVYVIEDCKFLKIRLLPSDHFLMLPLCSVAHRYPSLTEVFGPIWLARGLGLYSRESNLEVMKLQF